MPELIEQLSEKLAQAGEKNDQLETKLSYTEDQLALALSKNYMLEAQVKLLGDALNSMVAGQKAVEAPKPSKSASSLFGGNGNDKAAEAPKSNKIASSLFEGRNGNDKNESGPSSTPKIPEVNSFKN